MDPTVELRPARPAEAAAISRLLATTWRDDYAEYLGGQRTERLIACYCRVDRIAVEISASGAGDGWLGWQVADHDGTVVGAAAGGITTIGSGEVYNLCVDAEHRRRGIGRSLLDAVTGQQLARGAHQQWVNLHGDGSDTAALPFLTSQGFQAAADGPSDGDLRLRRAI
ncbi:MULTISPECIES: GNAT family N-acetyltransferase [Kitasatospora]|uniref:GNAT family N-acetyltransferase n=1 Tax=Kitasatospora TaxID=2063 RepID=UPI000C700EDC|nr:GNAT family N-acetyltransferase [Kitasatospora sp. GP30]MDH6142449.1 ribosomal protein S18 acetylase RimI-like enzyme [Kitasatospora sp. GP30]